MSDPERGCGIAMLVIVGVSLVLYGAVIFFWGLPGAVALFLVSSIITAGIALVVHVTEGGS